MKKTINAHDTFLNQECKAVYKYKRQDTFHGKTKQIKTTGKSVVARKKNEEVVNKKSK